MTGDHHDLSISGLIQIVDERHAIAVWQFQISQQNVWCLTDEMRPRRVQGIGSRYGKALCARNLRQKLASIGIVVNDEGVRHGNTYSSNLPGVSTGEKKYRPAGFNKRAGCARDLRGRPDSNRVLHLLH